MKTSSWVYYFGYFLMTVETVHAPSLHPVN